MYKQNKVLYFLVNRRGGFYSNITGLCLDHVIRSIISCYCLKALVDFIVLYIADRGTMCPTEQLHLDT